MCLRIHKSDSYEELIMSFAHLNIIVLPTALSSTI